jgi:hypothetical protein
MWDYIKNKLAALLDAPEKMREAFVQFALWLTVLAKLTKTEVDDKVAAVLTAIGQNDDIWEAVFAIMPWLLGVKHDPDNPVDTNPEVDAVASRIAAEAGVDVADAKHVLLSLGK